MRLLPELTPANEWFWTSGADGTLRIQGCDRLRHARPPAGADLPGVPQPVVGRRRAVSGRATVVGFTVNHAPVAPGLRPAVRDRQRGARRGRRRPPHHQHRRLRPRRRAHRPGGRGPLRAARRRVAPAVRADRRRRRPRPGRRARSCPRRAPPLTDDRFEHRSVLSGVGRSAIGRRLMRRPAVAHGRRLPRRGRRRRPHARRHRRAVDLPRRRRAWA